MRWLLLAVVLSQSIADKIPMRRAPRGIPRQNEWTYTAWHTVGASDLVCLGGVVMLAFAFHQQMRMWPDERDIASATDVLNEVCSVSSASSPWNGDAASDFVSGMTAKQFVKRVAANAAELQQQSLSSGLSEEQSEALIAKLQQLRKERKLHACSAKRLTLRSFVGTWTDGIREFHVEPDGSINWKKAARAVESFSCSPAVLNEIDGSLEFKLRFPPDQTNPTGVARWHLCTNGMLYQSFEKSMGAHPDLMPDGLSTRPLQWRKRRSIDELFPC